MIYNIPSDLRWLDLSFCICLVLISCFQIKRVGIIFQRSRIWNIQYLNVPKNFSSFCFASPEIIGIKVRDRQSQEFFFFFQINLLPPYSLCSQGGNLPHKNEWMKMLIIFEDFRYSSSIKRSHFKPVRDINFIVNIEFHSRNVIPFMWRLGINKTRQKYKREQLQICTLGVV